MNAYAAATKNRSEHAELMGQKRQQKALREFKEVLRDLVLMLREASGGETVYLYWINRDRRQFVMETTSTTFADAVFQDRVAFSDHFLDAYKDISQPCTLSLKDEKSLKSVVKNYGDGIEHITLLPFKNNEETVAITVLESTQKTFSTEQNEVIRAYINALGNVLNTYLEISDLHENQQEWVEYEESLSFLDKSGHSAALLNEMLQSMQHLVGEGCVSLIAKGMGTWVNVLNASSTRLPLPLGMPVEEKTVAWDALKSGEPEFAIHFNKNPKRISPRERYTGGATFAIPIIFNDYRKGLVLVYEQNPLVFKESTKHKLINMVRLTGLKIQARLNRKEEDYLLTNPYDAFIPDVWERSIDAEITRLKTSDDSYKTWVGLVTLSNVQELRTQLRLEDLTMMQKDFIKVCNPGRAGISGFMGFHADYVYMVMLQSKASEAADRWSEALKNRFQNPFQLTNGRQIDTGVLMVTLPLSDKSRDAYHVISEAKRALSEKMKLN